MLVSSTAACTRSAPDATPDGAVRLFLDRMEASTDEPNLTRGAFDVLGPAARANLEERARRTSILTGKRVEPYEMLAQGRFGLKFRPKTMHAREVSERATVEVLGADPAERASVLCVRVPASPAMRAAGSTNPVWRVEPELPEPLAMPKREPNHEPE